MKPRDAKTLTYLNYVQKALELIQARRATMPGLGVIEQLLKDALAEHIKDTAMIAEITEQDKQKKAEWLKEIDPEKWLNEVRGREEFQDDQDQLVTEAYHLIMDFRRDQAKCIEEFKKQFIIHRNPEK